MIKLITLCRLLRYKNFSTTFSHQPRALATKSLVYVFFFSVSGFSIAATTPNLIKIENALPGNPAWHNFYVLGSQATDNMHNLEGYANKDSVNIGQAIKFYVNANPKTDPTYSITVYRLGWYQGSGARQIVAPVLQTSIKQIIPKPYANGMVQANWIKPYTLNIPKTWVSGIYVATLIGSWTNKGQYIPFVVRDVQRKSDYLFQTSTTTWQAYNAWGGKSLYGYNSTERVAARKVSFNRPYDVDGGLAALRTWDINMLYFLEREGYDVTYQSDLDTHTGNGGVFNHKALLSVGHDEYWTKAMRDNFENAQKHGIGLGFFGANQAYWQIRMEKAIAPLATEQNRTIVAYKGFSETEDPLAIDANPKNNHLVTAQWRDSRFANRPENALIGVMYAFGPKDKGDLNGDIIASKNDPLQNKTASHWAYTNTDITIGATIGNFKGFLGYEADRVFDNGYTPAGLSIIASSPVSQDFVDQDSPLSKHYDPKNPKAHVTIYSKPCSVLPCRNALSTVFAAGSLQWVWGLDTGFKYPKLTENHYIKQVTRNVLAKMISAPLPY
jgi:hypothetical protein